MAQNALRTVPRRSVRTLGDTTDLGRAIARSRFDLLGVYANCEDTGEILLSSFRPTTLLTLLYREILVVGFRKDSG
jgi:hypothetical protein